MKRDKLEICDEYAALKEMKEWTIALHLSL